MRVQQPTERIKPGSGGERGRQEVIRSSGHGFNIIYLDRKLETLVAFFKNQGLIKHLSIFNRYVCFNDISKYLHDVHNIYLIQCTDVDMNHHLIVNFAYNSLKLLNIYC